jgi:hypothetical protein
VKVATTDRTGTGANQEEPQNMENQRAKKPEKQTKGTERTKSMSPNTKATPNAYA